MLTSSSLEEPLFVGTPRNNLAPLNHRVSMSTELWLNAHVKPSTTTSTNESMRMSGSINEGRLGKLKMVEA